MKKINLFDKIISPNITEKATSLSEFNKINTINLKAKSKFVRGKKSSKPGYKKAIVTLKKGQSIDLATGI